MDKTWILKNYNLRKIACWNFYQRFFPRKCSFWISMLTYEILKLLLTCKAWTKFLYEVVLVRMKILIQFQMTWNARTIWYRYNKIHNFGLNMSCHRIFFARKKSVNKSQTQIPEISKSVKFIEYTYFYVGLYFSFLLT